MDFSVKILIKMVSIQFIYSTHRIHRTDDCFIHNNLKYSLRGEWARKRRKSYLETLWFTVCQRKSRGSGRKMRYKRNTAKLDEEMDKKCQCYALWWNEYLKNHFPFECEMKMKTSGFDGPTSKLQRSMNRKNKNNWNSSVGPCWGVGDEEMSDVQSFYIFTVFPPQHSTLVRYAPHCFHIFISMNDVGGCIPIRLPERHEWCPDIYTRCSSLMPTDNNQFIPPSG